MGTVATTKLSSRGQVVIPEEIRKRLGFEPGTRFVVMGEDDVVVLKAIRPPSMADFDEIVSDAKRRAAEAGLTPGDVDDAIRAARTTR